MKRVEKEKFKKLIDRQRELDTIVLAKHIDGKYPQLKLMARALLDELGELNHETKAEWCWWKDTQKPVDRDKILEELVDCLHFALMIIECSYDEDTFDNHYDEIVSSVFDDYRIGTWEYVVRTHNGLYRECSYDVNNKETPFSSAIIASRLKGSLFKTSLIFIYALLAWGESSYGFTMDDVFKAYFKKSEINVNRVNSGY